MAWASFAETHLRSLGLPPLDFVFSDGLHTYAAVTKEQEKLTQLGLLQPPVRGREFTMVWDDCFVRESGHARFPDVGNAVVGHVARAVANHLRSGLSGHNVTFCFIHFFMSAWQGGDYQNSGSQHAVCLLTTLDVSTLLALPKNETHGGLGGEKCTDF